MFDDSGYNHPIPVNVGGGTKNGIQKNRYFFLFRIATCFCLLRLFYSATNLHWDKNILDDRWPVPEPYWYHGSLDVNIRDHLGGKHIGRRLQ